MNYFVCMSLVSFLKWLFVQVCCPTAKCPNLFVFLTQCVHPGRHFIFNGPAVVCILNESWCKQRNVHFNYLHLFHRCTCGWQALIIHWNNTSQNVAIGDVTTWSRHQGHNIKVKLSLPLLSTFQLLLLLLSLSCTPCWEVVQSVQIHGRSVAERKGGARNSFKPFYRVACA